MLRFALVVLVAVGLSSCGGVYSTVCGGRAEMTNASLFCPNYHLTYRSAECTIAEEIKQAEKTYRAPDPNRKYQTIHVSMNTDRYDDGVYEMIIFKGGEIIAREKNRRPTIAGTAAGTWLATMTILFPEPVALPLDVVIISLPSGDELVKYKIKPNEE